MNTLIDMILTRHSVRKFTGDPVSREDLEAIVRAGMAAPSAVNTRPWAFLVITERSLLDLLCRSLPYAKMLASAGAAIIVCGIPEKEGQVSERFWVMDCSAASENILLAAHALGYGAVWTAVYPEGDRIADVRKACGIPENIVPLNVIPVGIPVDRAAASVDRSRREPVHWDRW